MGLGAALSLGLALAVLSATGVGAAGARPVAATGGVGDRALEGVPADGVIAEVTWDGTNVDQASSSSSAFVLDAGQSALVVFNFTGSAGSPTPVNATLDLLFAGIPLSTESIRTATVGLAGRASLNWTFGSLVYLTQGAYEVNAELLDANGSVLFQEPFYVDARAPFLFVSILLDLAIILGVAEALWIRAVVRYTRRQRGRYRFH